MKEVVYQRWEETELGWGTRPDGFSLHRTGADRIAYVQRHNDSMKKMYGKKTPREYSHPDSEPIIVTVSDSIYRKITSIGHRVEQCDARQYEVVTTKTLRLK